MGIGKRKDDHIHLAASEISQVGSAWFEEVVLIHNALPDMEIDDVDISADFLGVRVKAPFGIGAMTGGTELAGKINSELAKAAEEFGIPIYVGSQRVALLKPEVRWTFEVVKKNAPTVPKVANLGAPQLVELPEKKLVDWAIEAVDMVGAHAIAIHLNAAQEVVQPEGEPRFRDVLEKIKILKKSINVPVVVKEVGNGISREVASRLVGIADAVDVGGFGGTSFIAIEGARAEEAGSYVHRRVAETFKNWGIPTAASICEVKTVYRGYIIASGGIRNGLDGAKAIALGANFFTMSQPFLKATLSGRLREEIQAVIAEVKTAMFLVGARKIEELASVPRVYGPYLRNWVEQRRLNC